MCPVARRPEHPAPPRRPSRRRLESLLRDPKGWPDEAAPLRVRTGVMSNLAAQRQRDASMDRVTLYKPSRWSRRHRLQFSLRPPLAAAAVIAMIFSAAVHFMGGTQAWQPFADGLANRLYEVDDAGPSVNPAWANATNAGQANPVGRDDAEALFNDVLRFRAHMTGRIPVAEPRNAPDPRPAPERKRADDRTPASP